MNHRENNFGHLTRWFILKPEGRRILRSFVAPLLRMNSRNFPAVQRPLKSPMTAKILDGKLLAEQLKIHLKSEVERLKKATGQVPMIVNIMIGDDASAKSYANSQKKTAEFIGLAYKLEQLPADTREDKLIELIENSKNQGQETTEREIDIDGDGIPAFLITSEGEIKSYANRDNLADEAYESLKPDDIADDSETDSASDE